jgi:hypothetical protein
MTCVSPELLGPDSKVLELSLVLVLLGEGGSPKIVFPLGLSRDIAAAKA